MNYLLDTHVLLWAAAGTLPPKAAQYFEDESNTLFFSPASLWEVVIKNGLGRSDFDVDASQLYHGLLGAGYVEIAVTAEHALGVERLPMIHKDPFDRILLSQAISEHCTLLTADANIAKYQGPIECI
jgi:Uncharacterized protein conserved in bacteria